MRRLTRTRTYAGLRTALHSALARLKRLAAVLRDRPADRDEDEGRCARYEARSRQERDGECGQGCDWPEGPCGPTGTRW